MSVEDNTQPESEKNKDSEIEDDGIRRFIHLKEARFCYSHSAIPSTGNGFIWRGKLSSVDSFILDSLITYGKPEPRTTTVTINGQEVVVNENAQADETNL